MALRISLFSLCLVLVTCLVHVHDVQAQQEFYPYLAEVTTDQVNVRAGQSANFERLCQLDKGQEIVVLAKEFSWYKVQLPPSAKSFVSKKYVQYLGQNAGGITADRVNIRAGAGVHFTIIGQLSKGEQIYIQKELDEWYRIRPVPQSYGWVAEQFLKFKSNDISEYEAKVSLEPVGGEVLEQKEIETSAEEDDKPAGIEEQEPEETFSAIGYVEDYHDADNDAIYYKIVRDGRPLCYVQGSNHMLNRFMHYKVSVEGTVNNKLRPKYAYPVIIVSKVRLML